MDRKEFDQITAQARKQAMTLLEGVLDNPDALLNEMWSAMTISATLAGFLFGIMPDTAQKMGLEAFKQAFELTLADSINAANTSINLARESKVASHGVCSRKVEGRKNPPARE